VSAVRIFSTTYLLGLALILLTVLVIVLAAFGIETIGRHVPLVYPILASVILLSGSKFALNLALRREEKRNG